LAVVADIAYRCARLNSHLEENILTETKGIVLIDDLDLHLHLNWQRRIVADLKRTFSKNSVYSEYTFAFYCAVFEKRGVDKFIHIFWTFSACVEGLQPQNRIENQRKLNQRFRVKPITQNTENICIDKQNQRLLDSFADDNIASTMAGISLLPELYEFLFRFFGLRDRQPHKPRSPKKLEIASKRNLHLLLFFRLP
jgi:hypothetical protein